MKPLLIVVPLHPTRECRAKTWLETKEVKRIADVKYLQSQPLGPPIFGKGRQLYTCGNIAKAVFESVMPEWRKSKHEFFGLCLDDVIIETPHFLERAIDLLENTSTEATGTPAKEIRSVLYDGRLMDCLFRCWIVRHSCLVDVDWKILWEHYELPEWEPMWMHYSKIKTQVFPDLKWSHVTALSGDCSDLSRGSVVDCYEGNKTWRTKP